MSHLAPLSVAIATLDRPLALARCVDALLSATVCPAEVVVVDQGDPAGTAAVLDAYADGPVAIRHVVQERRGLSAARNQAIAAAQYPIVAITDDDCVPDRHWIAALVLAFDGPDAPDAVTGRVLPWGPARPGLYAVSARTSRRRLAVRGKAVPWHLGTGGNCAVKRAWVERAGGYDEHLGAGSPGKAGEDADLFYRLLRAGARIAYEPRAVIYHERQSKARRLASRWTYGYGIGALCGIWLRRGDLYAVRMLGDWVVRQAWDLAGLLRRGQWWPAYTRLLCLGGTAPGLLYGLGNAVRT